MNHLPIVEIIGPTVQGEGPRAGRRAALIRLGGCNLTCQACDTAYAWDGTTTTTMIEPTTIMKQLATRAGKHPFHHVVITGGEPLIHQRRLGFQNLIIRLLADGIPVEIETNGTIIPSAWFVPRMEGIIRGAAGPLVSFVVSPKIVGPLATDPEGRRMKITALRWFGRRDCVTIKAVCRTIDDISATARWADRNNISRNKIWVMAEGSTWTDHITHAQNLIRLILAEGMNASPRLHLALWPDATRGH